MADTESLIERYARMAEEASTPRRVDLALRALDVAIGGSALVALSPLIALIAAVLRITSGRPVLYRGVRVGHGGRPFTMYKFRTLVSDAERRLGSYAGYELTALTERETTAFGRLLRTSQLDELPQLWNVLKGDMSIVGPRPIRPAFFESLCAQIPQYWQRLAVRPGLTGFAQTRMTRNESWAEKLAHDLEYIADRSVALYLSEVTQTAWRVVGQASALRAPRR